MQIRIGYELAYECPQPTPMILVLSVHFTRAAYLVEADHLRTVPALPIRAFRDVYGNWCSRLVAPVGETRIFTTTVINDTGQPDVVDWSAEQVPVEDLPEEALMYLLGSRYCETDRLSTIAWSLFSKAPTGWGRVQAICDFVHNHITFGYAHARATKSAWEVYQEKKGVCRDFAHLAVALCRCMNIPARYCSGYLGDIGVPISPEPMDFSGWFEVYLGRRWYTFDARHNTPRIGRVLIAQGRDAADVAMSTTFGPNILKQFKVITEELPG
jgi:transglutaminase-like putative cysteine protease